MLFRCTFLDKTYVPTFRKVEQKQELAIDNMNMYTELNDR